MNPPFLAGPALPSAVCYEPSPDPLCYNKMSVNRSLLTLLSVASAIFHLLPANKQRFAQIYANCG